MTTEEQSTQHAAGPRSAPVDQLTPESVADVLLARPVLRSEDPARQERLTRTPVVVLLGGRSDEREVSLLSGRAILQALEPERTSGADVLPERLIAVEIDTQGRWIVDGRALAAHIAVQRLPRNALYFLGLHGGEGEGGRIQAFLEICGRAYTGSDASASALCLDKERSRMVFEAAGLRVAPGLTVTRRAWSAADGAQRSKILASIRSLSSQGWCVKPVCGGSSVATFLLDSPAELPGAIERVLATGDEALVEALVRGLECTVAVLGNRDGEIKTLPAVEIRPRSGHFFDYEQKYSEGGAIETCPPRELSPEEQLGLAAAAHSAYLAAACDGYARVDFIVPRGHAAQPIETPVLLEINTLPGFTERSLYPQEAAAVGLDFRTLCLELCCLGLELRDALEASGT